MSRRRRKRRQRKDPPTLFDLPLHTEHSERVEGASEIEHSSQKEKSGVSRSSELDPDLRKRGTVEEHAKTPTSTEFKGEYFPETLDSSSLPKTEKEKVEGEEGNEDLPGPSRESGVFRRCIAGIIDLFLPALGILPLLWWTRRLEEL